MTPEASSAPHKGGGWGRGEVLKVIGLDHVVLPSTDIERSLAWYCDKLGLEPVRVDEWRRGEVFFPSVRVSSEVILDLFPAEPPVKTVDHVCLVVEPTDL